MAENPKAAIPLSQKIAVGLHVGHGASLVLQNLIALLAQRRILSPADVDALFDEAVADAINHGEPTIATAIEASRIVARDNTAPAHRG